MANNKDKYCPDCGAHKDRYLSVESTAKTFGLSVGAVRALIKRREVPFYKLGTRIRLLHREFEALLIRYPSIHEINGDDE